MDRPRSERYILCQKHERGDDALWNSRIYERIYDAMDKVSARHQAAGANPQPEVTLNIPAIGR